VRHALENSAHFSELLGILSTRFVTLSCDKVDPEITGWLERLCRQLGLDRSVIAEYLPEKGDFYTTYQWTREGFPSAPGPMAAASDFLPWVSANGATGHIVTVPDVSALPVEAARDRNFMLAEGPKAILAVPLIAGGRLLAGLTFEDLNGPRQWTSSLLPQLKLVADIFGNALERKRAAAEMNSLRDEAQRTARLALAGEMAAAMAHELSHPLGAILANAQAARRLLEGSQPNLGQLKEALDDVITGERRAAAYIAKVRSLFRTSELHTEALQVGAILDAVTSLFRSDLQARDISVQIQIEPGLPMVAADRVGIEQVMINLIQNAADAVCDGERSERRIALRALRVGPRWVSIAVDDTGNGIDRTDLGRIFEPLFTTKSKGTGMGLAIVRSIVEAHGAQIRVRSERGAGTTFQFALPVADDL
jgi:signal transduction histidine kinase